jgi:hypothetical protein
LKIDGVTVDYEMHAWQALEIAAISGGGYSQTAEVSILPHNEAHSLLINVSSQLNYAFIVTLYNQIAGQKGHILELDKEYTTYLKVIGDFKPKVGQFTVKPKSDNTIDFSEPNELGHIF